MSSTSLLVSVVFNVLGFISVSGLILLLMLIKKHTPALSMFKAKMKGLPLCMFFGDDQTFEMRPVKEDSGVIEDKKYGTFIVNSAGSYIDTKNKFVVLPFSRSLGVSVPAKFAKVTDSIKKVIGDESKMNLLRKSLMDGVGLKKVREIFKAQALKKIAENKDLTPEERIEARKIAEKLHYDEFDGLRESINYSSVKSMMNSITPQNVNNKINMTLVRKMGTFGQDAMKYLMILLIAGLGIAGLIGFLLYSANNPSPQKLAMAKAMATGVQTVAVNASNVIG